MIKWLKNKSHSDQEQKNSHQNQNDSISNRYIRQLIYLL
ncbi:hypothetical protein C900_01448 [Fulvivirga imtechensis AK7]|uniref:Uncharacterized protein n=1 Tax=Fulvivirga imtechensis AK7 TaxID=1237149 RepID=L8JU13_9BACT|nr:hypothetical protein C900_01448 [Fulvivirga imtechensis AK7]